MPLDGGVHLSPRPPGEPPLDIQNTSPMVKFLFFSQKIPRSVGHGERGIHGVGDRKRGREREMERETGGNKPFALHAAIH